jgi:hypothetical protein
MDPLKLHFRFYVMPVCFERASSAFLDSPVKPGDDGVEMGLGYYDETLHNENSHSLSSIMPAARWE